jgi:hypothetical protein
MKKEANLITSPVLREFYTTAVQKEWIVEDKLSKSASTSIDKYAATGNFMQDLVNLASGLRELGLYEQAESLEVKLNIFKKAQLAFSNLIDEQSRALQQAAHAESTKIVDAQGGWGVVHTNMDRQQKILETLTHQPGTGSPAPVMNNLVVAAAEALGLLKFAEDGLLETELSEKTEGAEFLTEEEKTKIEKINKNIISKYKQIFLGNANSIIANIKSIDSSNLFDDSRVKPGGSVRSFYLKAAEINTDEFNEYAYITTTLGSDKGTLVTRLIEMAARYESSTDDLVSAVKKLLPVELKSQVVPPVGRDNASFANDLADKIVKWTGEKEKLFFSSENKTKATEYLKSYFSKISDTATVIKTRSEEISNAVNLDNFSDSLIKFSEIKDESTKFDLKIFENNTIKNIFSDTSILLNIETGVKNIQRNSETPISELEKEITDKNKKLLTKDQYSELTSPIKITYRSLNSWKKSLNEEDDADTIAVIDTEMGNLQKFNSIIVKSKTFFQLKNSIKSYFKVKNFSELVGKITEYTKALNDQIPPQFIKEASFLFDLELVKKAQAKPSIIPTKGKPSGGAVPARPAGGGGAELTQPVELTETKKAVYHMQWALGKLGDYLMTAPELNAKADAPIVMVIGKTGGAISDPEGVWGVNTKRSLETARKYVKTIPSENLGPAKAFNNDQEKIKAAAEKNYELITAFLQSKGFSLAGAPGGLNLIFDRISETLNPAESTDQDGDVPVTKNDLLNLRNFFNFVRDKIPTFGWNSYATAAHWGQLINWFNQRSFEKISKSNRIKEQNLAKTYNQFVRNLSRLFLAKMKSLGIEPSNEPNSKWNTLLLEDILAEGGDLGDQAGGLGAGAGTGARGPEGRLGSAGLVGAAGVEGQAGAGTSQITYTPGSKRIVPFDARNIYLDSKDPGGNLWFASVPPGESILSMATVSGNPQNAATMYFPNDTLEPFQVLQYFVKYRLIPGTVVTDQATQTYLYKDPRTGAQYNVTDLPAYRNQFEEISQYGSLNSYKQFLTSLLTQLTSARKSAIAYIQQRGLPEKESDRFIATLDYQHNEWVRAIRRQLSRIQFI